jgi:uncharacterized membrane protein YraQ (UPF0718 family)
LKAFEVSHLDAEARRQLTRLALWVLALALIAVLLAAVLSSEQDAGTILNIFSTRFLGIFIEAVPFLLLGTLASGLIDAFVTADDIARLVPRNRFAATFAGTFLGFLFPVCECGVVPVVRRLYNKGLPMSVGVTFLLAAPVVNPVVLVSTYVAFGVGPVLIGRFVLTILVAVIVGFVFALAARPQDVLRPARLAPVIGGGVDLAPRRTFGAGLRSAMQTAADEFFDMGRYLILGTLLAATLQTLVSQEVLLALGRGPIVSVLVMQGLAFLLSVCSTVDSFLALAFVGTFTTGSLLAFLVFGPMVDIKSTLMFAGVFKGRVVLYLIILPLLLTMLFSTWLNLNVAF